MDIDVIGVSNHIDVLPQHVLPRRTTRMPHEHEILQVHLQLQRLSQLRYSYVPRERGVVSFFSIRSGTQWVGRLHEDRAAPFSGSTVAELTPPRVVIIWALIVKQLDSEAIHRIDELCEILAC